MRPQLENRHQTLTSGVKLYYVHSRSGCDAPPRTAKQASQNYKDEGLLPLSRMTKQGQVPCR